MRDRAESVKVFVETGRRRAFAGASDWPGWCRSGRNEPEALQALLACGSRYAGVVQALGLDLLPPVDTGQLLVLERLAGSTTTDFGAPDAALGGDEMPLGPEELRRLVWVLTSCFRAFEAALQAAEGRELRKGPRGGGRALPALLEHVIEGNRAYLQKLAWKPQPAGSSPLQRMRMSEADSMDALTATAESRQPATGPRGGKLWTPRFFVRRAAWHLLDHAWEIEDRLE